MEVSRIKIILIMGLMAFAIRALPQAFSVGEKFPDTWDRWLRYLSYAFICSIISITLFLAGAQFESEAASRRAVALALTVFIAHKTKSAVSGMICGVLLLLILTWLR